MPEYFIEYVYYNSWMPKLNILNELIVYLYYFAPWINLIKKSLVLQD